MVDTVQAPATKSAELPRSRLTVAWVRLPTFVRSFVIDAVEGAVASVSAITAWNLVTAALGIPGSGLAEFQSQAIVMASTVSVPVIAAGRRRLVPGIVRWLITTFPRPAGDRPAE